MRTRTSTPVLCILLLSLLLTGCGQRGCTDVAGSSSLRIQVPPAIGKVVSTFRVELCQDERCAQVNFPSRADAAAEVISEGITLEDQAYTIDVDLFGASWKPERSSGLTVLGFDEDGRSVLRRTEQFAFEGYYPNGVDCDPEPFVRHSTAVTGADLVG